MASRFQIVGFLFATLTISGVALAQQGGGNGGGGGSDSSGGQNDNSIFAIRQQDHERLRVPGAVKTRAAGANCLTYACNEPPRREPPPPVVTAENCGDSFQSVRDRNGRIIRRICEFRN
ncbi:hypothetical protein [Bosea beijingensis]|uniref:hypothetical protein n=1 Tax=Bosea beijingensis TaxID=3068632 RepID=UPI0027422B24|nr:hypothetical protein [Bosea sp. REN20]